MAKNLLPVLSTTVATAFSTTAVAAHTGMTDGAYYMFQASSNCWIRQGTSKLVTFVAKANLVDGETVTITANGTSKVYEFDVNGTGVTSGNVQVNVSADTTAANVAARFRTAVLANQSMLTVTDPTNGTLIVDLPESTSLTISETVANASFTIGTGIMQATAGSGSMFWSTNMQPILLKGTRGGQLGVIRATADGTSSTARVSME